MGDIKHIYLTCCPYTKSSVLLANKHLTSFASKPCFDAQLFRFFATDVRVFILELHPAGKHPQGDLLTSSLGLGGGLFLACVLSNGVYLGTHKE